MDNNERTQNGSPPYTSISTFNNFLDWLREMNIVPSHIDRSLWSTKFGGSVGTQLMTGLRFLGLLKGEQPTERLVALARANAEDRKSLLANLLRDAYGEVVINELETGTPKRLNDALGGLGTTSSTHDKARSFLINAAKLADLPILPAISKQARIRKPSVARRGKADANGESNPHRTNGEVKEESDSGTLSVETRILPSGAKVSLSIDINPIALSIDERNWLFALIDAFKSQDILPDSDEVASDGRTE